MTKETKEKGTLIRGADGALYYISDTELSAHRLPDDQAAKGISFLDQHKIVPQGASCPAFHGEGLIGRVAEQKHLNLDVLKGIAKKK